MEHILPIIIAGLSFWASVVYAFHQSWLPSLYWFAAFLLNYAVIAMSAGAHNG